MSWQKPEEQTDERNEPEPYTSMGCSFDPNAFNKLKEELENEKK